MQRRTWRVSRLATRHYGLGPHDDRFSKHKGFLIHFARWRRLPVGIPAAYHKPRQRCHAKEALSSGYATLFGKQEQPGQLVDVGEFHVMQDEHGLDRFLRCLLRVEAQVFKQDAARGGTGECEVASRADEPFPRVVRCVSGLLRHGRLRDRHVARRGTPGSECPYTW